ncbi:WhiB family transcriptional regulator [Actinocrinis sp.]|uniref:WhiB family transcriptional regulator n=1 Tax=Actinocrinis sp. TaxID=1920516 RepID=UPI002D670528|nr:WhiB family transcriptional regulator [Actinocrinis sp.]HZP51006.1 WhiB family transcriptional regulator [Actinocrinis sp.]
MPPVQAPERIRLSASAVAAPPEASARPATRAARPRKAPVPYPMPDDDWQERGACRTANPSLFFAPDHESNHQRRFRETAAKAICAHCPVRAVCRAYALQTGELYGIWGGTTERERMRANANPRQAAATSVRK